jgi:hypothetical protein
MNSSQHDRDNRANQLNPNNGSYWSSRSAGNRDDDDDDEDKLRSVPQDWTGQWADYNRRLQQAQQAAIARGGTPPTSVPIFG